MNLEEFIWLYLPLIIAISTLLFSILFLRKNPSLENLILTMIILVLNGISIFALVMIFLGAHPSYLPILGVCISFLVLLTQYIYGKKLKTN